MQTVDVREADSEPQHGGRVFLKDQYFIII